VSRLQALYVTGKQSWQVQHNTAITEYLAGIEGSENNRNERVVLSFAEAIATLMSSQWGTDGFVEPNCTMPMMVAFHNMLNIDLGRLDGGLLSDWLIKLAHQFDVAGVE
jgi:hypothetical protein